MQHYLDLICTNNFLKEATEKQSVKSGKIFGLFLAVISMIILLIADAPDGLFSYIQQALGSLSVRF